MDKIFQKTKTETVEEYERRISSLMDNPDYDLNWTKVAMIINSQTGNDYSADRYRKRYRAYEKAEENCAPNAGQTEDEIMYEYEYNSFNKDVVTIDYEKGITTSTKDLVLTEAQLNNPAELLKAHGYNPDEFELKSATNTKSTRKSPNGDTYVYASRITIKPKKSLLTDIQEVAKCFENFKAPKFVSHKSVKPSNEYLLVPLYDLHFGRLPDTEHFDHYDINEEKERIINHVKKYIDKFHGRTFKSVYLIIGQDFLNSSFTGFTSSQSHLQSNAIDFRTMFKAGSELLISIIDMFGEMCNSLQVVGSLGNHDVSEEIALFSLIKAYYRNSDFVNVDDGTAPRKYLEIGNACVGLGHLDKESKRAYGLMQVEAKDIWARTKTHIFVAGHLHHFSVSNENGVELYRVPSICPPDRWTIENGYTMSNRKTMCFIFDNADGLIETHFMYL